MGSYVNYPSSIKNIFEYRYGKVRVATSSLKLTDYEKATFMFNGNDFTGGLLAR